MIQALMNLNFLQINGVLQTVKQKKVKYNQNNSIKFKTESIKSSLRDYYDTFILVTADITINAGNSTDVVFKNCLPFSTCKTEINDVFADEANHI